MDYRALAENLIGLRALLYRMPAIRKLSALERGTFSALNYLAAHREGVHPKELSEKMGISSARVAALLNHMEREGLAARTTDPGDHRQILVLVTEAGERLNRDRTEEAVDIMARAFEELGPEEAEAFLRINRKLVQYFMRQT
ncbi:MAG TPA: MarR family transcriptional regulator [Firmicutes bacterium]|nr:MarR family transcriptional regulator [Bacillota bacterium]